MHAPTIHHHAAARRNLAFLNRTRNAKLRFVGSLRIGQCLTTEVYVDSDWAQDRHDRRSMTGYAIIINGNVISTKSAKQRIVALSSTEAEYIALVEAVKQLKWLLYFRSWTI